jgi:hypothetical protein
MPKPATIQAFIDRWQASGAAERANFPQFAVELCDLLDLARPDPSTADDTHNAYVFKRAVPLPEGTLGRIRSYAVSLSMSFRPERREKSLMPPLARDVSRDFSLLC